MLQRDLRRRYGAHDEQQQAKRWMHEADLERNQQHDAEPQHVEIEASSRSVRRTAALSNIIAICSMKQPSTMRITTMLTTVIARRPTNETRCKRIERAIDRAGDRQNLREKWSTPQ